MIWSDKAIDYEAGMDIYDPETNIFYTDEEARKQEPEIRKRLLLKPRKYGCFVLDWDDLERIRNEKRSNRTN